jgi:hypothetical protein
MRPGRGPIFQFALALRAAAVRFRATDLGIGVIFCEYYICLSKDRNILVELSRYSPEDGDTYARLIGIMF